MSGDRDISSTDQDHVIKMMLIDDDFLAKCIRKKLVPDYFSSLVRKNIVKLTMDFFFAYGKAPNDSIVELVSKFLKGRGKSEEQEKYDNFLVKIYMDDLSEKSEQYLLSNIGQFSEDRVIISATNSLLKLRERLDSRSGQYISLMRKAIVDIDAISGGSLIESILDDDIIDPSPVVTKFGMDSLDSVLGGGLKAGRFVILLGFLGRGKSWAVNHLAKMATRYGVSPLYIPIEMPNRTARLRFKMSFGGLTEKEIYENPGLARSATKRSLLKKSDLFILSDKEKEMSVDDIPSVVDEIRQKHNKHIKLILIDSADDMEPPKGKKYRDKIEGSTEKYTWLKNYAKDNDICIITTVQSQRRGGEKKWLDATTISDDITKARRATVGISLNVSMEEEKLGYCRIYLFKHTDGRVGTRIWVKQDFSIGQFVVDWGKYNPLLYKEMIKQAELLDT